LDSNPGDILNSNFTSRRALLRAGLALPVLAGVQFPARAAGVPRQQVRVAAPFDMPAIGVPDFSSSRRFPITQFGADLGDKDKTTAAIAAAIAAANAAGSGVVVVPPGEWLTGQVHLKSNVNLHLSKGATLLFSENPADYLPAVQSSWEGVECFNYSPLVYAFECENVAISGEGKLKARMDVWQVWAARPKAHLDALVELYYMGVKNVPVNARQMTSGQANLRPQFVQFNRCRNVLMEDFSIENSPFWTVHLFLSQDVVVRRLKIRATGHNNDGVDPEMCQNVLIEDCVFEQGDDAVSVKSGREFDAWRLNVPSRNIVLRNCRVKRGHQLMAIGSEVAGGIENVFVDNCDVESDDTGRSVVGNLLYVKTNERRGGFVKNIYLSNVRASSLAYGVLSVETDVLYQWKTLTPTIVRKLTPIEGLHVSNVQVERAKYVCLVKGDRELPVKNVTLHQVKVGTVTGKPIQVENLEGFVNQA
jgi:polygalacturonase